MDEKQQDFLVIGAALPRTGTMSLMYALERILPGKCHHGMKAIHHEREWIEIMNGKYSDEQFKSFLLSNGYVAAVDMPFCILYKRAMEIFPNAKVVLTVRDAESWVKSFLTTCSFQTSLSYYPVHIFSRFFNKYLLKWSIDDSLMGMSHALQAAIVGHSETTKLLNSVLNGTGVEYFDNWICEVELNVPEERLLKFNVKDGWGPLCDFLNVPVPDVPFPKVNSTAEFESFLLLNRRRSWLLLYEIISLPILAYAVYKLTRC